MLRIAGSTRKLCDGLTRRDLLQAGALGGLGLAELLRLREASAAAPARTGFGQAKSCILLFLFGSPSQHDTFDPKPDAPAEIRGELKPIASRVPGLHMCELFPRLARLADQVTIVRSLTHAFPIHGVAYALTAIPALDAALQLNPRDGRHWPFIGSVIDYLEQGRRGKLPRNIALPYLLSSRRAHPSRDAGPYGHGLGPAFDPVWTEFEGQGTESLCYDPAKPNANRDPYGGVMPDHCRFPLAAGEALSFEAALPGLENRRALLRQFNATSQALADHGAVRHFDRHQQRAFELMSSNETRAALDIQREPLALRERYGMHLFGQATLAARRLVEAGSRCVTVFWDDFHHLQSAWDTHTQHFPKMRKLLCPGLDQTFTALVEDLQARGRLDETVVACISEHGRTPKLNSTPGGGRDHWSNAYSALFAGGGFARGKVVGKSDRQGGEVADLPISPKDILATIYHLMGIDPQATIPDRLGRPLPIAGDGEVRFEMLG